MPTFPSTPVSNCWLFSVPLFSSVFIPILFVDFECVQFKALLTCTATWLGAASSTRWCPAPCRTRSPSAHSWTTIPSRAEQCAMPFASRYCTLEFIARFSLSIFSLFYSARVVAQYSRGGRASVPQCVLQPAALHRAHTHLRGVLGLRLLRLCALAVVRGGAHGGHRDLLPLLRPLLLAPRYSTYCLVDFGIRTSFAVANDVSVALPRLQCYVS